MTRKRFVVFQGREGGGLVGLAWVGSLRNNAHDFGFFHLAGADTRMVLRATLSFYPSAELAYRFGSVVLLKPQTGFSRIRQISYVPAVCAATKKLAT